MLDGIDLGAIAKTLQASNIDGWLLYDFRGINPVARRVLRTKGMATRRLFVFLPADGSPPTAVAHRIELQGLEGFPGIVRPYSAWHELHESLRAIVAGKKVAMEVSPRDEVPYLGLGASRCGPTRDRVGWISSIVNGFGYWFRGARDRTRNGRAL